MIVRNVFSSDFFCCGCVVVDFVVTLNLGLDTLPTLGNDSIEYLCFSSNQPSVMGDFVLSLVSIVDSMIT